MAPSSGTTAIGPGLKGSIFIGVATLKYKSDFVDWFLKMGNRRHVGTPCTDNSGEYVNQPLQEYCAENGILVGLSVPHTPQQNGEPTAHSVRACAQ